MISSDGARILAEYLEGPSRLQAALEGLSEDQLDLAPAGGGWTIRMIVHHVADGDDIWKTCIKQAIGNPESEFSLAWYWQLEQDSWAERWGYRERPIGPSLALFRVNRDHIGQLLEKDPGALGRTVRVRWPEGQEQDVSIGWVLEMQSHHVQQHVHDIQEILTAHAA